MVNALVNKNILIIMAHASFVILMDVLSAALNRCVLNVMLISTGNLTKAVLNACV